MSYTGAISDSTTGLSYMNARYYNPATGTFTSQDTYYGSAYSPWTQHLYSYTGGNPVNYVDPTGHRYTEFATMEGEQYHKDAVVSFSEDNYDSYRNDEKKEQEEQSQQNSQEQTSLFQPESGTFGTGINISAMAGPRASFSIQYVTDSYGNYGYLLSIAFGGGLGVGVNPSAIISTTNAESIYQLKGWGTETGTSVSYGTASAGAEYVVGAGYSGSNLTFGEDISPVYMFSPVNAEMHSEVSYSWFLNTDNLCFVYYAENGYYEEANKLLRKMTIDETNKQNNR